MVKAHVIVLLNRTRMADLSTFYLHQIDSVSLVPSSLLNDATFVINFTPRTIRKPIPRKWGVHATTKVEDIVLSDEEQKSWDASRGALSAFEFSAEEENKVLGKAFGYVHSPFWSEERAKEVPRVDAVNNVLNYLRSLNLTDVEIGKILKKFPEVLGCDLEGELENNVKLLEKEWGIEGKTLKNLLLRNPKVLGYNVDCKGDCIAKCTRCWVRF
ncbi:OLC1v1015524C2 [Oldenlandia corymbosa var. corymbosa]|uniref:OLC1v1015524C2 n=1 Tax=Oldenlandia corymbosa var. corymbosa TaxID=529605 RepID=A0AAV1E5S6_OLDCO|nr:OLC1v1015524C2 [Oldenlandia corymbosa var. corymbosa]